MCLTVGFCVSRALFRLLVTFLKTMTQLLLKISPCGAELHATVLERQAYPTVASVAALGNVAVLCYAHLPRLLRRPPYRSLEQTLRLLFGTPSSGQGLSDIVFLIEKKAVGWQTHTL